MTVAIGFAGLFLGWALGFGGEIWRERRQARDAARLVTTELLSNRTSLRYLRDVPSTRLAMRSEAWRTYGLFVVRVLDLETATELASAYDGMRTLNLHIDSVLDLSAVVAQVPPEARGEMSDPARHVELLRDTIGDVERQIDRALPALAAAASLRGLRLLLPARTRRT